MTRPHFFFALLIAVAACSPDGSTGPDTPAPRTPPPRLARLSVTTNIADGFVGMTARLFIDARDNNGNRWPTSEAIVSSDQPSVAEIVESQIVAEWIGNRSTLPTRHVALRYKTEGTTTVRVELGDMIATIDLRASPLPPPTTAMTVELFKVIEFRTLCDLTPCLYPVYAPVLYLRAPAGSERFDIIGVEFMAATETTGLCTGRISVAGGEGVHVNQFDVADHWGTGLTLASRSGTPLPNERVRARVIVRDSRGVAGVVEATGSIERVTSIPFLPPPTSPNLYWSC